VRSRKDAGFSPGVVQLENRIITPDALTVDSHYDFNFSNVSAALKGHSSTLFPAIHRRKQIIQRLHQRRVSEHAIA
jgi:hypothetical protein